MKSDDNELAWGACQVFQENGTSLDDTKMILGHESEQQRRTQGFGSVYSFVTSLLPVDLSSFSMQTDQPDCNFKNLRLETD